MTIWIVIYQTNLGEVFGWFCKAESPSQAEKKFWGATIMPEGRSIKCIAELQSEVIGAYFSLYEEGHYGE